MIRPPPPPPPMFSPHLPLNPFLVKSSRSDNFNNNTSGKINVNTFSTACLPTHDSSKDTLNPENQEVTRQQLLLPHASLIQEIPRPKAKMKSLNWSKIPAQRVIMAVKTCNSDDTSSSSSQGHHHHSQETRKERAPSSPCSAHNLWSLLATTKNKEQVLESVDFDLLEGWFCQPPPKSAPNSKPGSPMIQRRMISGTNNSSDHQFMINGGSIVKNRTSGRDTTSKKKAVNGDDHVSSLNILDRQKALNVNIFLKQYREPTEEIISMIREGDHMYIGSEGLVSLMKLLPGQEEERQLVRNAIHYDRMPVAEKFLLLLIQIPRYLLRIECMMLKDEFESMITYVEPSINVIKSAAKQLQESENLREVLYLILVSGNFLNSGGYAGDAAGFKIMSLLKLSEIRANKPGLSFIHFLAQQTEQLHERQQQQRQDQEDSKNDVAHFYLQLPSLDEASKIAIDALRSDVESLSGKISRLKKQLLFKKEDSKKSVKDKEGRQRSIDAKKHEDHARNCGSSQDSEGSNTDDKRKQAFDGVRDADDDHHDDDGSQEEGEATSKKESTNRPEDSRRLRQDYQEGGEERQPENKGMKKDLDDRHGQQELMRQQQEGQQELRRGHQSQEEKQEEEECSEEDEDCRVQVLHRQGNSSSIDIMDEVFFEKMHDFVMESERQVCRIEKCIKQDLEETRLQLARFLCEDERDFKLEESFRIFSTFCHAFKTAQEENRKRRETEQRLQARRSQVSHQQSHATTQRAFNGKGNMGSLRPQSLELTASSSSRGDHDDAMDESALMLFDFLRSSSNEGPGNEGNLFGASLRRSGRKSRGWRDSRDFSTEEGRERHPSQNVLHNPNASSSLEVTNGLMENNNNRDGRESSLSRNNSIRRSESRRSRNRAILFDSGMQTISVVNNSSLPASVLTTTSSLHRSSPPLDFNETSSASDTTHNEKELPAVASFCRSSPLRRSFHSRRPARMESMQCLQAMPSSMDPLLSSIIISKSNDSFNLTPFSQSSLTKERLQEKLPEETPVEQKDQSDHDSKGLFDVNEKEECREEDMKDNSFGNIVRSSSKTSSDVAFSLETPSLLSASSSTGQSYSTSARYTSDCNTFDSDSMFGRSSSYQTEGPKIEGPKSTPTASVVAVPVKIRETRSSILRAKRARSVDVKPSSSFQRSKNTSFTSTTPTLGSAVSSFVMSLRQSTTPSNRRQSLQVIPSSSCRIGGKSTPMSNSMYRTTGRIVSSSGMSASRSTVGNQRGRQNNQSRIPVTCVSSSMSRSIDSRPAVIRPANKNAMMQPKRWL